MMSNSLIILSFVCLCIGCSSEKKDLPEPTPEPTQNTTNGLLPDLPVLNKIGDYLECTESSFFSNCRLVNGVKEIVIQNSSEPIGKIICYKVNINFSSTNGKGQIPLALVVGNGADGYTPSEYLLSFSRKINGENKEICGRGSLFLKNLNPELFGTLMIDKKLSLSITTIETQIFSN